VVPQGFVVFFPVVLGGDFRCPLLVVFLGCFLDLALVDLMGEICGNPSWFFGVTLWNFLRDVSNAKMWISKFRFEIECIIKM
jgi:hypothetical protein